MKLLISSYLCLIVFTTYSQNLVTTSHFSRTFNIHKDKSSGTGFIINHKNKHYWITAKHVLGAVSNNQEVEFLVRKDTNWVLVKGSVLIHSNPEIDIAVISPKDTSFIESFELDHISISIGEEGFFLGFPFGLNMPDKDMINNGFPIALVKRCTLSGYSNKQGVVLLYLDGSANPGFSGGPVFFKSNDNKKLHMVAVIAGYLTQKNTSESPSGKFDYHENSGIILAYGSNHIIEIINQKK